MDKQLVNIVTELSLPKLEKKMLNKEQADCPVIHHFAPGIYIRELNAKAGLLIMGHHHKTEHLNICLKGKLTLFNEDGTQIEISAPYTLIAKPGRKTAYIQEDLVWLNIFATEETDIEKLEDMFFEKSDTFNEAQKEKEPREKDILDFHQFLKEFNFTAKTVRKISENELDQIPLPLGAYSIMIQESSIEGKGVFATAPFNEGEIIAPARIGIMRTPAGRYTNHAKDPNAEMKLIGNDFFLYALRNIEGNKGGQSGEEITVDYRQVVTLNKRSMICPE